MTRAALSKAHADQAGAMADVSAVVIGRNEGAQLEPALRSALDACPRVVYVDSASTDGSVPLARSLGAHLVELSDDAPVSAARGRNEGFNWLRRQGASTYVQFLDGDCVLEPGWVTAGVQALRADSTVGVVAGRLRERRRERNIYHRLADMEWDGPPGDVESTGGIMMVRSATWQRVGGMDPGIKAGEELDFCLRVREAGWRVVRINEPMASHEIDIAGFAAWWRRAERGGVAYAEGWWRRRTARDARPVLSALFWGGWVPAASLLFAAPTLGLSLALLAGFPHMWWRVRRHRLERGDSRHDSELYALFCILAKGAELSGICRFVGRLAASARRASVTRRSTSDQSQAQTGEGRYG